MGKSYRQDARNDRWRKQKQQKQNKKYHRFDMERKEPDRVPYSPFDDPPEYHESFA